MGEVAVPESLPHGAVVRLLVATPNFAVIEVLVLERQGVRVGADLAVPNSQPVLRAALLFNGRGGGGVM